LRIDGRLAPPARSVLLFKPVPDVFILPHGFVAHVVGDVEGSGDFL
jgi:hypothetical protein